MTSDEIFQLIETKVQQHSILEFPADVFGSLDTETSVEIVKRFGKSALMRLPQREQDFFEWLAKEDPPVWNDLWSEVEEEAYVVSLAFLPALLDPSRGFPVCDLLQCDNYFFVPAMLHTPEAADFVQAVRDRFTAKHALTVEQLLALECSLAPIDIWHFAWHHEIKLSRAKQAVERLVDDKIIVHVKAADQLADWIE